MFGKKRKGERWFREAAERGLQQVDEAPQWLRSELAMLAPELSRSYTRPSFLDPSGPPLRYTGTRSTRILRSAVAPDTTRPGVIAAFDVVTSDKNVGHDSLHHRSSTTGNSQVIVARLRRPTRERLLVVPHHSPKINERFEQAASNALGVDIPPRLDHPLLQHWWLLALADDSDLGAELDPSVAAALWAIRLRVAGSKPSDEALAAQLEAMIPPCDRHFDGVSAEFSGDLLALFRHSTTRGLDDPAADQAAHVAQHFG